MKRNIFQCGYSLVELMVAMSIVIALMAAVSVAMGVGRDSWMTTTAQIEVRENMRSAQARITREFRETGSDKDGNIEMAITAGGGANGSDVVTFAVPILCNASMHLINSDGDVQVWGAPLTWGCHDVSCMDQDGDCSAIEYRRIQYRINESDELVRIVLAPDNSVVATDVFAENLTDLRVRLIGEDINFNCQLDSGEDSNGNGQLDDGYAVAFTLTGTMMTVHKREENLTSSWDVRIRNRGCSL